MFSYSIIHFDETQDPSHEAAFSSLTESLNGFRVHCHSDRAQSGLSLFGVVNPGGPFGGSPAVQYSA